MKNGFVTIVTIFLQLYNLKYIFYKNEKYCYIVTLSYIYIYIYNNKIVMYVTML